MFQPNTPEEWCAVHEAGHAVHAYLLGIVPNGCWIEYSPGNKTPKGMVETPGSKDAYAPLLCSGIRAEVIFGRPEPQALQSTDTTKLLNYLRQESGDPNTKDVDLLPFAKLLHLEVLNDLSVRGGVEAIESVATALLAETPQGRDSVYPNRDTPIFPMFEPPHSVKLLRQGELSNILKIHLGPPGSLVSN